MQRVVLPAVLAAFLCGTLAWAGSNQDEEREAIRKDLGRWQAAFNRHDIKGLLASDAADSDVRTVRCEVLQGLMAIARHYEEGSARFPQRTIKLSLNSFRTVHPEAALLTTTWEVSGSADRQPVKGLTLSVLRKQDGKWLTVARRAMVPDEGKTPPEAVALPKGLSDPKAEKVARPRLEEYAAAYNKGDVRVLMGFCDPNIEQVGARGTVTVGARGLEKHLQEQLAKSKGARLQLTLGSARFITSDVILYDGAWETTGGDSVAKGCFSTVAVRREGKWLTVGRQVMTPYSPSDNGKKP